MIELKGTVGYLDESGDGIIASDIVAQIKESSGPLDIMINSPGGVVAEGIEIYQALMEYPDEVNVTVNVMAASIASVIAAAGDSVVMYNNAQMMIHKAWTVAVGNSDELRKVSSILDQLDRGIAEVYAERTGKDIEELMEMMAEEKYMTAEEAVELGFADEIKVMRRDRNREKNEAEKPGALPGNLSWATALARASVVRNTLGE